MKTLRKFPTILVTLACVASLGAVPLFAGVVVAEEDAPKIAPAVVPTLPVPRATPPAPIAKTKQARKNASIDDIDELPAPVTTKKYVLRCWQQGQLILERHVDDVPPDSGKTVPLDSGKEANAGKDAAVRGGMRLFDLRNATCLLQ
jgi:hypothetical protein